MWELQEKSVRPLIVSIFNSHVAWSIRSPIIEPV